MMSLFIPGLELCRRFYGEVVEPLVQQHFPHLDYAAARIGAGSEVLGFDTPMSMDHDWGPTVMILLRDEAADRGEQIRSVMRQQLPPTFLGFPVAPVSDTGDTSDSDPRHQAVWITTCRVFCWSHLRLTLDGPLAAADWLTLPAQLLREVTAGAVFHDSVGELTALRSLLAFYPHDVWLYLLAAGWQRIAEEEHLMGRAGYVGDELGASLIAGRLVRDIMALAFLMERQYAPYPKWFGSAFGQLACADALGPLLWRVQQAATWQEREAALVEAYRLLAEQHNALGLTEPLPLYAEPFFSRPFLVINGGRFATALCERITNAEVQAIAARGLIGGIDQWSDSTVLRANVAWRRDVRALYHCS